MRAAVLADDLVRVEEHLVAGGLAWDEDLVPDVGDLDDDVVGAAGYDVAAERRDQARRAASATAASRRDRCAWVRAMATASGR